MTSLQTTFITRTRQMMILCAIALAGLNFTYNTTAQELCPCPYPGVMGLGNRPGCDNILCVDDGSRVQIVAIMCTINNDDKETTYNHIVQPPDMTCSSITTTFNEHPRVTTIMDLITVHDLTDEEIDACSELLRDVIDSGVCDVGP